MPVHIVLYSCGHAFYFNVEDDLVVDYACAQCRARATLGDNAASLLRVPIAPSFIPADGASASYVAVDPEIGDAS